MFNFNRRKQFELYNENRSFLIENPRILIDLEEFFISKIYDLINDNKFEIKDDYNEASFLYPFWQNYPPDNRGRQPRGDQYPWIEVGEHSVGRKLSRQLAQYYSIKDVGGPTGADERFLVSSPELLEITNGNYHSIFLSIDIKSVGPRDDAQHAVMSHNQVSGDGKWEDCNGGLYNTPLIATGVRAYHEFHCSMPPLYVFSNGTVAPVITIVVKPVYDMLSLNPINNYASGQPLKRISLASIPNGILLNINPNYLSRYPGLFYPGKDDKGKSPLKVRARVDFKLLSEIDKWRYNDIYFY
ncbi:TPA: BglI family type II restriction endonuclease [Escherichia fergusonii]|uniref:BglI family type II restriction endonuclease n=1 Tax=Enterobacterales TaxID=91347 RepID=UPI000F482C2A|nr:MULTISPECIES: BglI family type II restriction endonuclease [Enterobacterales]EDX3147214.1 hypothetical protein [Salmonella enterica subsp. diarizonae serovar 61:l,v:1,5,7]HAT3904156.1 BglI family type II restriction endonuclease [Citrobacter koseri]MEB8047873.1 BglI family type II restriction endonuclease [Escherichia fergusonii]MEB8054329.1 BglI family type II restriction endonuclease [Escherichia fergusonii]QMF17867.1 BglI family type II restriction endonuclease [Escherichia fergusonii]